MARVFLSYRSLDQTKARALETQMRGAGHQVFLDCLPEAGIPVGADWERQLYDELYRSDAIVALISTPYVESQWCFAELAIARARGLPILPMSLEANVRHPLLTTVQHIDGSADVRAATDRLLATLRELDAPGATGWSSTRSPYVGLEPFDVGDRAIFFGRSQEISSLVELVGSSLTRARRHPIFVTGASGSGKSSLVRAGLIPELHRRGGWLNIPPVVPGDSPIDALSFAIDRRLKTPERATDLDGIARKLRDNPSGVWRQLLAASDPPAEGLLIVIDQFEELFRPGVAAVAREFLAILDKALAASDPRVSVVATLRSDAVDELYAVWERRAELVATYVLPPLGQSQLAEVIRGPARVAGIAISDALVATLVEETGDGTALPFLSYVLRQLAKNVPRGGELTLERYRELGGVKKALGQQADEALTEAVVRSGLEPDRVLQKLTELVGISDSGTIVRRRRRVMDANDDFQRVLTPFIDNRLLTVRGDRGETFVDVAHESFFQAWQPLAKAIEAQQDLLKLRRQVERDAATWDQAGRPATHLWSAKRAAGLKPFLAELAPLEQAFLQAATELGLEQARTRADSVATQLLLADLPITDPEVAIALSLAIADECSLTPRVVRCLQDALTWYRLQEPEPIRRLGLLGMRAASLALGPDLVTVSTDVEDPVPEKASTMRRSFSPRQSPPSTLHVRRWRLDRDEPLWATDIAGSRVATIAGCPGVLAIGTDRQVVFIDAETGRSLRVDQVSYHVLAVEPVRRLMGISVLGGFEVRRVDTGELVRTFKTSQHVSAIRFSATGDRVSCRSGGVEGGEWDIDTGTHTSEAGGYAVSWPSLVSVAGSLPKEQRAWSIEYDEQRSLAAVWTRGGVVVWSLRNPGPIVPAVAIADPVAQDAIVVNFAEKPDLAIIGSLAWHELAPRQLASATDGRRRLLERNDAWLVDVETRTERPLHRGGLRSAAFSANGRWLALAYRTSIVIHDADWGSTVATLGKHSDEEGDTYCAVAITDDGSLVVSGSLAGGRSHVWTVGNGERLHAVRGIRVAIDASGKRVLAADHTAIRSIDLDGGFAETRLLEGVTPAFAIPLGEHLRDAGNLQRASLETARRSGGPPSLVISADGRLVAISSGYWVALCDLPSGEPLSAWALPATHVAFGPGDRELVVHLKNGRVLLSTPAPTELVALARRNVSRQPSADERARFTF